MNVTILKLICIIALITSRSTSTASTPSLSTTTTTINTATRSFSPSILLNTDITAICCDIDGTILDSNHQLPDVTYNAIKRAMDHGFHFFPCTGRSRPSMASAVGSKLIELLGGDVNKIPGCYQQGLMVYDLNGQLIYERLLTNDIIIDTVNYCKENGISVIAYAGDRILCHKRTVYTDSIVQYHEPIPEEYERGLEKLIEDGVKVHKLILLDEESRLIEYRGGLEKRLHQRSSLTKAVPGMLEVLPYKSNKGDGVARLLESVGISRVNMIAFGDGENDIEMLQLSKIAVAVSNARASLIDVATCVCDSNDDYGVATSIDLLIKTFPLIVKKI